MKNKVLVIIILIILYLILSFVIDNKKIIYFGSFTKVYINNKEITKVENNNEIINGKKVKYYQNNSFYEGYLYSESGDLGNAYSILNNRNNKEIIRNDLIATTPNLSIKVKEPELLEVSNSEIDLLVDGLNIEKSSLNENKTKKYVFDLDSNGTDETIYKISYKDPNGEKIEFVLLSNSNYTNFESYLVDNTSAIRNNEELYMFVDFFNKGDYYLLIQYSPKLEVPYHYKVYKYKNDELSIIE